ncbi:Phosphopantothenoylcysteine decarboxylase / Phosphopantothenoylcysteine synthetase [hydrothermal vent metagenome]|uniref:Phosphopantothenoylcysteine decarboxylase / Phosphopantothenoylcysteine synthetase n=1 Tax=hydrothermal vent metagenome TaxID=652676 RepID=A0A3B1BGT8_9ZZZZ
MKNKIVLGVTGGIAAYKAADIARRVMELGFAVQVVMTKNAEAFITPLTFEALTGNKVLRAGLPTPGEDSMPHITLQREARLVLVAPATANIIGKFAHGIADDSLSTLLLASDAQVVMAPAMNTKMYENEAVQKNIATLKERGVIMIGPAIGTLACGDEGAGKLSPVEDIVTAVESALKVKRDFANLNVIVTAGGTREPLDAVRFIGNSSSGKMGFAIATALKMRGANVTIISGATEVEPPDDIKVVNVKTAEEMRQATLSHFDNADILIMSAAVSDYRMMGAENRKVKKNGQWDITLVENPDILMEVSKRKRGQIVIGFAAETENPVENGKKKLLKKNMDMIVINDVSRKDIGFASDYNEITTIRRTGELTQHGKALKSELAEIILDNAIKLFQNGKDKKRA